MKSMRASVLSALGLFLFCHVAFAAKPPKRLYVFGDSYSDIGRGWVDSDGPTAVAYLAKRLGLTMVASNAPNSAGKSLNFAVSGAPSGENPGQAVPHGWLGLGMKNQVSEFVAMVHSGAVSFDPETTLFFLAGGLNDHSLSTEQTVANLEGEIDSLYAVGARRFSVAILPEKIPAFRPVAVRLNPALRKIPTEIGPKLKGAEVRTSQWGAFFDVILENPSKYGFTDVTNQCAGRSIFNEDTTPCATPATHFYYHEAHPSTAASKVVGDMLYDELMSR
ncbi:SGNH/GDSL hydrolase family protein [Granulicella mallensis]|uniref:Phospholipase/lecithinase/hemolysin n=1 Tax=Granulicella mallensis TaxID=940614 RepID=A0A7W7ZNX7_9BACT|nr:SGNH/GDSL hydrolase family protein [Granulicella mallensis]MBB5063465.1 phospholipase/lecithinase/hemolysin [Granulicella mallensis]